MKILFLSHGAPNQFNRIRAFNTIKCLSKKHELHVLCLSYNPYNTILCGRHSVLDTESKKIWIPASAGMTVSCLEEIHLAKVASLYNCAKNIFSNIPFRVAYCQSAKFQNRVHEIIKENKFDCIYAKRKRMAQFVENIKIPKILDLTDSVALQYERMANYANGISRLFYLEETKRLRNYEPSLIRKFNVVTVASSIDKRYLEELTGAKQSKVMVVPNVVDTEFFKHVDIQEEQNTILFSGLMDKKVNIDACLYFYKDIFPLIKKTIPAAKFIIVGPNPIFFITKLKKDSSVIVTGIVDDIRNYIAKAAIIVCPLRIGTGTRNKILQAMAMGKAIVSTSLGAEGLELTNGKELILADEPIPFANKIAELLNDSAKRKELGVNACSLIKNKYSLEILENQLEFILKKLMAVGGFEPPTDGL